MHADQAHSLRRTGQQSMHHLKEAEIHKSELTGVLEIPIILGIQIFRCQLFACLGNQGQGSQASTISRQLNYKILTLQMILNTLITQFRKFQGNPEGSFLPVFRPEMPQC